MTGRYQKHSKVMTIANQLVKQGYNRAYAMVKAWALVKLSGVTVKVAGVTYGKRQTALEHLTHYRPQDVRISLCRDKSNAADKNAVAVIAAVRGKGAYTMGYLRRSGALSQLWNENRGEGIKKLCPVRPTSGMEPTSILLRL